MAWNYNNEEMIMIMWIEIINIVMIILINDEIMM